MLRCCKSRDDAASGGGDLTNAHTYCRKPLRTHVFMIRFAVFQTNARDTMSVGRTSSRCITQPANTATVDPKCIELTADLFRRIKKKLYIISQQEYYILWCFVICCPRQHNK